MVNPEHLDDQKIDALKGALLKLPPEADFVVGLQWNNERVQAFEAEHKVKLPQELRWFLTEVGELQGGPANLCYTLEQGISPHACKTFPLTEPFLGSYSFEESLSSQTESELLVMWNSISKDTGILKICSYGEGIEAQLVLNGVFCGMSGFNMRTVFTMVL